MSEIINNTTNENETQTTESAIAATSTATTVESPIKLHVLDSDGTAQAIALMQIGNKNMLIDSGSASIADLHLAELARLGVTKIDYICITHYHGDHVGGLATFAAEGSGIDIDNAVIFLPKKPTDKFETRFIDHDNYENALDVIHNSQTINSLASSHNMTKIFPGDTVSNDTIASNEYTEILNDETGTRKYKTVFNIGSNNELELDFKNFDNEKYYTDDSNSAYYDANDTPNNAHNNSSLCCIMTYGKTRIGFFGDISNKAQEHLYHNEEIGHLDLMSVEHHGKNGGFYRPFYDAIAPKMCFTQDGDGLTKDKTELILAEKSKTQAYLQENNIPNYAVSINGTMTFDIYKSGISTKEKAVKYAHGIKGVTSFMGAINNSISTPKTSTCLAAILKNMEHGTFLSTLIKSSECHSTVWNDLVAPFVGSTVSASEMIIYKGGSTYENQSAEPTSNAGYIILIPHSSNSATGNIMGYWYTTDVEDYSNIKVVLKQSSVNLMKSYSYTNENISNIYPSYNSYPMF